MAFQVRRTEYFYVTVKGEADQALEMLSQLAQLGVNLLALSVVPMGPSSTQLQLFPTDGGRLALAAARAGLVVSGPYSALLVQGDDELGALTKVHARLTAAKAHVFASSGVTDGHGHYGYVIHVRPEDYEKAAAALEV